MKETEKTTKTIGLILEDAYTDFALEIIHSVAHAILDKKDIRLIVVAGRQIRTMNREQKQLIYRTAYNYVYALNGMCHFDGVLLTFPNLIGMDAALFGGIPRIYIASDLQDELLVNYDNEKGIREAVNYLVKVKGLSRLCMLGGRDDNADAIKRKRIFVNALSENGLSFSEKQYVRSDMTVDSYESAAKLMAENPDTQAVFCVNDPVAVGLYDVMREKGLVPGRDIQVFGFDNGAIASELVPPLASIGAEGITLGEKALNMLLEKLDGNEICSQTIPTRLYGRESCDYEMNPFTARELLNLDSAFIYRFFDECFYRYKNEVTDQKEINLRRLFYEILLRMLGALKDRYMSEQQYAEILRLIDIFFENGGMRYTDANRFVRSIGQLQSTINEARRAEYVKAKDNRLFSYMKDKAIESLAFQRSMERRSYMSGRDTMLDFMIYITNYGKPGEKAIDFMVEHFDRAGFKDAALYLYEEPFVYEGGTQSTLPSSILLRCVVRDGTVYVIPKERQFCPAREIYSRKELPPENMGYITYPLFYGNLIFGVLVLNVSRNTINMGEFITMQLGRMLFMNWGVREVLS